MCSYGDTCGAALTSKNVKSTTNVYPWKIHAPDTEINGYSSQMCFSCLINNAASSPFQIVFSIIQRTLKCDTILVSKSMDPIIKEIPYQSQGQGLNFIFKDFYHYSPIVDCTVNCTYQDLCTEEGFTGSSSDVYVTSYGEPWQITASTTNIYGYSKSICLKCESNNALIKSPFFSTIKFILNSNYQAVCTNILKRKSYNIEIKNTYDENVPDKEYYFMFFFDFFRPDPLCTFDCNVGD